MDDTHIHNWTIPDEFFDLGCFISQTKNSPPQRVFPDSRFSVEYLVKSSNLALNLSNGIVVRCHSNGPPSWGGLCSGGL